MVLAYICAGNVAGVLVAGKMSIFKIIPDIESGVPQKLNCCKCVCVICISPALVKIGETDQLVIDGRFIVLDLARVSHHVKNIICFLIFQRDKRKVIVCGTASNDAAAAAVGGERFAFGVYAVPDGWRMFNAPLIWAIRYLHMSSCMCRLGTISLD